nr:hypothetical protein [Desulforamulus aquiferis]
MKIRLGGITSNSVVDGPGLRTVVFFRVVQGIVRAATMKNY